MQSERKELLNVGGNSNNGSICGLSASNSNNAFSNSNANIGARLNFKGYIKPTQNPFRFAFSN